MSSIHCIPIIKFLWNCRISDFRNKCSLFIEYVGSKKCSMKDQNIDHFGRYLERITRVTHWELRVGLGCLAGFWELPLGSLPWIRVLGFGGYYFTHFSAVTGTNDKHHFNSCVLWFYARLFGMFHFWPGLICYIIAFCGEEMVFCECIGWGLKIQKSWRVPRAKF